jgi:xanthine dehydrogenase YagS FAD-binding subunit
VNFRRVADALLAGAIPRQHNGFKIDLARLAIPRALHQAANGTPQSHSDKRIK